MIPAIPFITAAATSAETVAALIRVLTVVDVRDALAGLQIVAMLPPWPEAYEAVMAYEAEAAALGYPVPA